MCRLYCFLVAPSVADSLICFARDMIYLHASKFYLTHRRLRNCLQLFRLDRFLPLPLNGSCKCDPIDCCFSLVMV